MDSFEFKYFSKVINGNKVYRCICTTTYNGKQYQSNLQKKENNFDEQQIIKSLKQYIYGQT